MRIDWQVPVPMRDGTVLRADVFRPVDGRCPVILSHGPYAKGQSFQEAYAVQWERMVARFPEILDGSSCAYQCWELTDPERWVPHDYAVVRVDSRGAGWSPGVLDLWSPQEIEDFYECVEWAAVQQWSDGNVGLLGISYYAVNQWLVAGWRPPHLKAMIPWEGMSDHYRELCYHGGIRSQFLDFWYPRQLWMQYGYGDRARTNPNTGESVAGPVTLSDAELASERVDPVAETKRHPLCDEWHQARSADWDTVTVPFLSAANWGGQGLHLRGNIAAFTHAASDQKWLEIHGLEHWTHFYTDYGLELQRRFFDHFLKGVDNGWDRQPRVLLQVRHVDGFVPRGEDEWPIARTRWTRYHLHPDTLGLETTPGSGRIDYQSTGEGVTFSTEPLAEQTEITGPIAARLRISSSTSDADLFLVLRVYDPDGREVVFQGVLDPHTPVAQGWLRASHRRLDPALSRPYQPHHTHDQVEPLVPGATYELHVEIWPTSIVVPAGYRVALTVRGNDYAYGGEVEEFGRRFHYASRGCGPFVHTDPDDRPPEIFENTVTLHGGSYLLLPIVPPKEAYQ